MKVLMILSLLFSFSSFANDDFISHDSAEDAAAKVLNAQCGGLGELLDEETIDEDYDYAVYFVEMTNGTATVVATDDVSYDGNYYNDIAYEVTDFECL